MTSLSSTIKEARNCILCRAHLPFPPKPVLRAHPGARILLIGQAPGLRVQESGVPWQDPSGDRLREWMGVDLRTFYDERSVAIIPMGFCYPGRGKSGDLPPRPECAPTWHPPLIAALPRIRLTVLIGQYAIGRYLAQSKKGSLTETVQAFREYEPTYLPLVHPSPRNKLWLKKNPWFEATVVPYLRRRVAELLG